MVTRQVTLRDGTTFDVVVDKSRLDSISLAILKKDTWFLEDYYVLLDRLHPGDRVLDLGGHVGTFSLAAAALGAEVACVEASPDSIAALEASVGANRFDRMRVIWAAVSDHDGVLEFVPNRAWGTVANPTVTQSPAAINAATVQTVRVPAMTVHQILRRLGWSRVDFVKVDIEGSEIAALRSMSAFLAQPDAPIMLIEMNPFTLSFFGESVSELAALLGSHGYHCQVINPDGLALLEPAELGSGRTFNCLCMKETTPVSGWSEVGHHVL
jgi:FkbM family methyltransferase